MLSRRQLMRFTALATSGFAAQSAYSQSEMTMTFNTGNPVGSNDARDLSDNARNFDLLSVGAEHSYPDRLGVLRKSWAGLEQQVADFLASQGWEPVFVQYAAGALVERPTQLVEREGELYRVSLQTNIPLTLSGEWENDSQKLVAAGNAALRSQLADINSALLGSAMIGRSVVVVRSMDELKLIYPKADQSYLLQGYYSDSPMGGGVFVWDANSSADDNGGTIISVEGVTSGRLIRQSRTVRLSDFGVFDGRKPISDLIASAATGVVQEFDVDVSNASDISALKTPYQVDADKFTLNGVSIFKSAVFPSMASIPSGFKARALFPAYFNGFGVSVDFDASSLDIERRYPATKKYYVDPVNGSSGGDGSEASPLASITQAIAKENTTPSAESAVVIYAKPGKYDQTSGLMSGLAKPFSLKAWGVGKVRVLQGRWGNALTWTNVGGGIYSTSLSAVISVFDDRVLNDLGDPSLLVKAASLETMAAATWFQSGSTLYVRLIDSREPDINVGIGRQVSQVLSPGTFNTDIYAENIEFLGGAPAAMQIRVASAATKVTFTSKNCRFAYSGGNGAELYGVAQAIHQNAVACYNTSDGYNYHSNTSDSSSESVCIEINCKGYRNGVAWSAVQNINNGSTAHDNCVVMRYGTIAFENQGPNIADVNGTYSYNFGCIARDSVRADGPDKADFDFSGVGGAALCRAWLDQCSAPLGLSTYALTAGGDCIVRVRNSRIHPSVFGMTKVASW